MRLPSLVTGTLILVLAAIVGTFEFQIRPPNYGANPYLVVDRVQSHIQNHLYHRSVRSTDCAFADRSAATLGAVSNLPVDRDPRLH